MISKTKMKARTRKKTSPELKKTIAIALKNPSWNGITKIISGPTRLFSAVNLDEIDKQTKLGDTIIIPGKVLSKGELTKKIRIAALSFSLPVFEKAKKSKSELVKLREEILKNKKMEGIKILR